MIQRWQVIHKLLYRILCGICRKFFPRYSCFDACTPVSRVSLPWLRPERSRSAAGMKPVCVHLIECRSQAAAEPGTMAGRERREGAAGHRDPLDIVLLPTDIWGMEGRSKGWHEERWGTGWSAVTVPRRRRQRGRSTGDVKDEPKRVQKSEVCRKNTGTLFFFLIK